MSARAVVLGVMLVGCTSYERPEPEMAAPAKSVPPEPTIPTEVVARPPEKMREPPTRWISQWGGQDFDEVSALAVTPDGATWAVGEVAGAIVLGSTGGQPLSVLAPLQAPNLSGLLVKYGPGGELRFAVPFAVRDDSEDVAATPDGGAVVVGSATPPLVTGSDGLLVRKQPDGFIARYDAVGRQLWRHSLDGPSTQTISRVVAHPGGGYVIAGTFHGESRFEGDPAQRSFGAAMKPRSEEELGISYDVFVARIGEDGQVMWIGELGSEEQETLGGLAVGADGTVVLTGECREQTRVVGGARTSKIACGHLSIGGFLAAWQADGELKWAARIPGPSKDTQSPHGVAVLTDGSVVAAGMFSKGIGGGEGLPLLRNDNKSFVDGFVVGYTAEGRAAWLRHVRGPWLERVWAVEARAEGGVWVLADGTAEMTFGDGETYERRVPRGGNNGLLLAYDAAGTLLTAELFGGKPAPKGAFPRFDDLDPSEIRATAMAATATALRIGGSFGGPLEFPGEDGEALRQVATAQLDGFVVARPVP